MGLLFFGVVIVVFLTFFLCFLGPVSSWRWIGQQTSTATRCFYCKKALRHRLLYPMEV
jgi:hypothetical protein